MVQRFRENDPDETKVIAANAAIVETLKVAHDDFWGGAYTAAPLGDVLYAIDRDPMVGVLSPSVYRTSFPAVHEMFKRAGTFEFYVELFRAIWGDDVAVTFTVPAPGKLVIGIGEIHTEDYTLVARRIEDDAYVYDRVVTGGGDGILVRDTVGTKNQSEVDALIEEVAPDGVYTRATLTL